VANRGMIIFFVAIRGTIIFFVAIRGKIIFFVEIGGTHLSAVCHNIVKSSSRHFASTVRLFAAPCIFVCAISKV
jgi:hypothetical protein